MFKLCIFCSLMLTNKSRCTGFSLIEVIIVLAIISICATLAVPVFIQPQSTAYRREAVIQLSSLAAVMEHYQLEEGTYEGASLSRLGISEWTTGHHYQLAIRQATRSNYLLAATPSEKQAERDVNCGTLLLDSLGEKSVSGSTESLLCW